MPIVNKTSELPALVYDFVIVGGGNAGNVLANRLSENPNVSVLLLEAGGSHDDALPTQIPFSSPELIGSKYDWGYSTTPQAALDNRVSLYPRGFGLGGSSAINHMVATRGSADDYDRYAKVTGDDGWSWKSMLPYFEKNENFSTAKSNEYATNNYNQSHHSSTGRTSYTLPNLLRGSDKTVLDVLQDPSNEFNFSANINSGNPIGGGYIPLTVKDGERSSSATSYLTKDVLARPNLTILVNALVTKVAKTGDSEEGPVFQGVEFVQNKKVETKASVTARKEVILSAGAVGTPAILLHSGIGDARVLESLGIASTLDLSDVGQNLSEHPATGLVFIVNSQDTFETLARDQSARDAATKEWTDSRTGPFSVPVISQLGFWRLPKDHPIFSTTEDPASGPNTPHYELMFVNGLLAPTPLAGNFLTIAVAATQPTSLGSVTIASNDPLATPLIDPKLLNTEVDKVAMREAFRAARRFAQAPAVKEYILNELSGEVPDSDEAIDAYLRATAAVVYHPTGTAKMSARGAKDGVVDPDLKVKGAKGIRVVDASVFPFIPSAHTMVPVYAVAERAADLIKSSYA